MAFDQKAQRFALVDLDYDPDFVAGFSDAGAFLMTTDWGEDIDTGDADGGSHTGRLRRLRYY